MATYSDDKRPLGGQDGSELFWLAYCYVAGELSAAQMADFETRLEVDQPAREAVAQAVEMAAAVQGASESFVELPASRRGMSPVGGWAFVMAASIALAVVGYSFLGRNALHDAAPELSPADRQLADAWAASTLDESESEVGDEANRLTGSELAALNGDENDSADGELLISDWLLEAVSAAQSVPTTDSIHREG